MKKCVDLQKLSILIFRTFTCLGLPCNQVVKQNLIVEMALNRGYSGTIANALFSDLVFLPPQQQSYTDVFSGKVSSHSSHSQQNFILMIELNDTPLKEIHNHIQSFLRRHSLQIFSTHDLDGCNVGVKGVNQRIFAYLIDKARICVLNW